MKRVKNPKNVRIRAGVRAFIGLSLFVVLLVPSFCRNYPVACKILFYVSLLLTLVEAYFEYRRRRPRARMRDLWVMMLALSICFVFMMGLTYFEAEPDALGGVVAFGCFAALCALIGAWALLRWRRLRADAEARLWQLKTARRKRAQIK